MKKHFLKTRIRAFRIWQKLGFLPWKKAGSAGKKGRGDFYKGAFDSIPFLNDDAKRTFVHLLLRPGYMIRDYIRGESALAAASAYILCQFSFFMLFALLLSFGESKSIGGLLMLLLLTIDFRQLLDVSWGKGVRLSFKTGFWFVVLLGAVILLIGALVLAIAWIKSH